MNKQRRKILDDVYDKLQELLIEVSTVKDEEQEAFDNLPESLQGSEKGESMEQIISELEAAESMIEEAMSHIDNAKN